MLNLFLMEEKLSHLEHLIENAISSVESHQPMEEWIEWERKYGNLKYGEKYIKATPEEIWEIAVYVVCRKS